MLASGTDDELHWGDDAARAEIAKTVLAHRLQEPPSEDYIRSFVDEIAADWENGQPWVVYSGDLHQKLGL